MIVRILMIVLVVALVLLGFGWLGFRVPSTAFAALPDVPIAETMPIPTDLPLPVQRFARAVYGERLPVIHSAIVTGHGSLAPFGMDMAARFRFYYDVEHGHYHEIDTTWYTLPIMHVHERFLDGVSILDIPMIGHIENYESTNHAGNQGFWAEMLAWLPAAVIADSRVRWETLDTHTVKLYLPDADMLEALTLKFDTETGLISELATQRYRDQGENAVRLFWQNHALAWGMLNGVQTMVRSNTQWETDAPWATWEIEQVVVNADVSARLNHFGD
jgi:hypothetical protein